MHRLRSLAAAQKGMALPIVLAVLALGALVIAPFLAHAAANASSSRTYVQLLEANSAAEAGIEKAIWDLTCGNLAPQIPAAGNSISYQLPRQVNRLIPSITVTHTQSGSGGSGGAAAGTITHQVLDTFQFNNNGNLPRIIQVSSSVLAVVYADTSNRGILQTIAVASDGNIAASITSSLVFDNTCYEPDIVAVSGDIFAIAYRSSSAKGYLSTVAITQTGIISQTIMDKKELLVTNTF